MSQPKVLGFRPFKIPPRSSFLGNNTKNEEFMAADLAKSGLTSEDLFAYCGGMIKIPKEAEGGYVIPYFDPDGQPICDSERFPLMYRVRLRAKPFVECQRYIQPSNEQLKQHGLSGSTPYFPPYAREGDTLAICEGEKKTVAVIKHLGLDAIGIGGCWSWGHDAEVHPWILAAARGKKIILIPDADVMRFDIARAYGNLAHALTAQGCEVEVVSMPDKVDDWIVAGGTREQFDALPRLPPTALSQTGELLIEQYNLAFAMSKDKKVPYQHSSNVTRLMEAHPAFPRVWANHDTGRVMCGLNEAIPDHTEMEVANYFQHNLGFDKVGHRLVRDCLRSLSKKNAKSPFLDWVRSQTWDGEERLASWMVRHWGIEDTEYVREVSIKWLVSAVARLEQPGTKIDWMLIVVGPQGTGKTSMPAVMFKENNLVLYGDNSDKDLHMKIHSALCIGFDELDSFGKKETSFLKAMITTSVDHYRPPYGSSVEVHGRRSVLYGCGNRHDFLMYDPSGYRRYAIVEANRLLDFAGLEAELGQLWAEAHHIWSMGECKFYEITNASAIAEKFVAPNLLEEEVTLAIEKLEKVGEREFQMSQLMIYMDMGNKSQNPHVTREVAAVLRKLGYEKFSRKNRYVWAKE